LRGRKRERDRKEGGRKKEEEKKRREGGRPIESNKGEK